MLIEIVILIASPKSKVHHIIFIKFTLLLLLLLFVYILNLFTKFLL